MSSWPFSIVFLVAVALTGCQTVDDMQSALSSVGGAFTGNNATDAQNSGPGAETQTTVAAADQTAAASAPPKVVVGTLTSAAVVDGDTIELAGRRIRLFGIDAPETSQPCQIGNEAVACGLMAKNALIGFSSAATIRCDREDTDRYGRDVSRCFADGYDLSEAMVRAGFAVAYRKYSLAYATYEETAKAEKRGIWKGTFAMPWDWRAGQRQ
jgi:endonuclease YncB( thermonuclease family)